VASVQTLKQMAVSIKQSVAKFKVNEDSQEKPINKDK